MIEFLIWLFISFTSAFGVSYLYYKLTNSKQKINLKIVIVFMIGVFLISIFRYYEINAVSFISFFLFYPILFSCLNKLKLKNLLFYSVFIWLYGMVFDLLVMVVLSLINYFFNVNVYSFTFRVLPTIFLGLTLVFLGNMKFVKRFTDYLYKLYKGIEYFNMLIISLCSLFFIGGIALSLNIKHLRISILLYLVIALSVIIILMLVKYRWDKLENRRFLKTLKENNDFYIKMDDENRIFKHNLAAKLLSIKSVSNQKAQVLIEDFLKHNNKTINYSEQIKEVPYGLNGIIYQKLYPYLDKLAIKINNQIKYDIFEVLTPRRYNVFVEKIILSIDNAIESALKSKDKVLIVDLYDSENNLVFEVRNSFSSNLNIDELGMLNYSTKAKKRGLGLFSMLRDKEASIKIEIINDIFVSKITTKKRLDD